MNNTRARLPETDVVLGASGGQEVVDLLVNVLSTGKILLTTNLSFDEMVTNFAMSANTA